MKIKIIHYISENNSCTGTVRKFADLQECLAASC